MEPLLRYQVQTDNPSAFQHCLLTITKLPRLFNRLTPQQRETRRREKVRQELVESQFGSAATPEMMVRIGNFLKLD